MDKKTPSLPLLQLDSILPACDGWLRCSTLCLLGGLGLLAGLLSCLRVDQTVRAQGVIRPSTPNIIVSTSSEATLSALNVSENEVVVADQALAELRLGENIKSLAAPRDGIVLHLSSDLVGQPLPAGTSIMQIASQNPELTLRLQVETQDIAQISIGQPVKARIAAYPYPDYGVLEGRIEKIAPDVTPCSTCSTAYGYVVNVELPSTYIQKQNNHYPLVPGMDVTADVVTYRTSLLSVVLSELRLFSDI